MSMKERRSTIRLPYIGRAHYCPSADLLPRDGWIANISDTGVSLYAQENHLLNERITVSFVPEDEKEPLTATGVVNWSSQEQVDGRWYPTGISWLPIEENSRERFEAFIDSVKDMAPSAEPTAEAKQAAPKKSTKTIPSFDIPIKEAAIRIGLGMSAMAVVLGIIGVISIWGENRTLVSDIHSRDAVIQQMELQTKELRSELLHTRGQLLDTGNAIMELETQGRFFQDEIYRLSDGLERFQEAYAKSREQNELLNRELGIMSANQWDLFSDRSQLLLSNSELKAQLDSIPSLRRALSSAIAAETAKAYQDAEEGQESRRSGRRTVIQVRDPEFADY